MAVLAKTYKKHSGAAFFNGFLALLYTGTIALFLFFPVYTLAKSGELFDFTGLDFLLIGGGTYIDMLIPGLTTDKMDIYLSCFNEYHGENLVFGIIFNFHNIIELVFAALLALSVVLAVFVLLTGFVWFIRGRLIMNKNTLRFARWSSGLFDSSVGVLFFINMLINDANLNAPEETMGALSFISYGILIGQTVIVILLHITWRAAYKGRVLDTSKADEKREERAAAKSGQPGMVPVFEKGIPQNISNVGDHAYAKDDSLTNAVIPGGVTSLGNNAFAGCRNLESVTIPQTVTKIGANCFYNTPHLKKITYLGTKDDWRQIRRGANWLVGAGTTTIITANGAIVVNPNQ